MKKEIAIGLFGGFMVGAVLGLLLGQSTRKAAEGNIKTSVNSGVISIDIDAGKSLKQGIYGWF